MLNFEASITVPMSDNPLSFSVRSILIVTTNVLGFGGKTRLSGSAGIFAAKRACFKGATTMKMINKTSSTSISGVTLIKGVAVALVVWLADIFAFSILGK